MKVRHIIGYIASCIFLRLFLLQNVLVQYVGTWPMFAPLLIYLWSWSSKSGTITLQTSWFWFTGFATAIIGVSLFFVSFFYWWKRRKNLVKTGPYRWIRHPQYLGFIIMTFGISWITVGSRVYVGEVMYAWTLTAFLYIFLALYEDESLAREYEKYEEYRKEVPFIFPGICSTRIYKKLSSRFMEPLLTIFTMFSIVIFLTFVATLAFWWGFWETDVISILIVLMTPLLLILITIALVQFMIGKRQKSIISEVLLLLLFICTHTVAYLFIINFRGPPGAILFSLLNLGHIAIFFSLNLVLITVAEKVNEKLPLGPKIKMMIALTPLYAFALPLHISYMCHTMSEYLGIFEISGSGIPLSVIITTAILMKMHVHNQATKIKNGGKPT